MNFVFLSTQAWDEMDGAGRPTHYLARELLRRGHRVLFVQVVASRAPAADPHLTRVSFGELGLDEHALRRAWFGLDPQVDFVAPFTRVLDEFAARGGEGVVVYGDPFVPFVALFPLFRTRGFKIVYDALDAFEAFPEIGLYFASVPAERYLVAQSDLVLAVSTTLVDKLSAWQPRAPVQLLRQGFDPHTFNHRRALSRSSDERNGVRPLADSAPSDRRNDAGSADARSAQARAAPRAALLGFWGQVNAFNVDVELVEYVAAARPPWTIQLIGPVDADPALPPVGARLRAHSNIQLVGRVPHERLPDYLAGFDVALVPFPDNAFNRARDPLKVLEYLSGYKPIVAAHTPQLVGTPYLSVADSPKSFLDAIERALALTVDRARVDEHLRSSTWEKRLDTLLAWLEPLAPAADAPPPDVRAWYADAALAPNLREYIARTEQLLVERTNYVAALEADSQAKQTHIRRLQRTNPFWRLKELFAND